MLVELEDAGALSWAHDDYDRITRESEEGDKSGDPLSARNLAAINQKLQSTRIADLIRQQACIHIAPGKAGAMVFREHFIAMTELRERVSPGVNLFTSAWLFQYLTETLDKRVLSVIGRKNFDELKEPISLNLNIGTVLSRDFSNFMRVVGDNAGKIVVELQIIDIFADMNTYGYARDMLQDRGYKVLVDGVNPMALQFFDPANLRKAVRVLGKSQTARPERLQALEAFASRCIEVKEEYMAAEEELGEVPDEFQDPITAELMTDPVRLPSGHVVDRSVIQRHLLSDENDPFSRAKLTVDMLVPDAELKEKIDEWRASKRRASAEGAMDTS